MNILRFKPGLSLMLFLGQLSQGAAIADDAPTLTNAADIHRLSAEAAARGHPVKLKGVVTYSDPQWSLLFVRDSSAGAFVALESGPYPTNGELVELVGRTEEGGFLPVAAGASWRHLGTAPMPEPRLLSQPERFASEIDCEWSELVGIVRQVSLHPDRSHVQIEVTDGQWRVKVFLPASNGNYPAMLNDLVDARISVLGVVGVDYDHSSGEIILKAFVPGPACLRVLERSPVDAFQLPCMALSGIHDLFLKSNTPPHRLHIHGIVTYLDPRGLVLQDDDWAVRVLVHDTERFKMGDALEAAGFISPGMFAPVLENAEIRPSTQKLQAKPVSVAPAAVLWGNYDARLVRLAGILQTHQESVTNHVLTLLQDGVLFGASCPSSKASSSWSQLKKGDRVGVTGVCVIQGAGRAAPQSFQVMLRSADDARYESGAHEFTAQQVLLILAMAASGCGVVFLWGVALRRRVGERTRELARSLSLLNATIESTADGILVVDPNSHVRSYNTTFAKMWPLPQELLQSRDEHRLLDFMGAQLKNEEAFRAKVHEAHANPLSETFDSLDFKDGRIFERISQPQRLDGMCIGRVWSFRDVTRRKHAEAQLATVHNQLLETTRRVGMAEVATAVLHNVGNVLNSVNVSATLVNDRLLRSRADNLARAAELIEARMNDLDVFLAQDPKGKKLRVYLKELSATLSKENDELRAEVKSLRRNIDHIKTIVAMQQSYAQVSGNLESLEPKELMENALQINGAAFDRDQIRVARDYKAVPQVLVDRHKALQILINLLSNARHALESTPSDQRRVGLSIFLNGSNRVCLRVIDNGSGIPSDNLGLIFSQGFTTRKDGHGFGLHSASNAAREMNGSLFVQSDGPEKGAVFTLELPVTRNSPAGSIGRA